MCVDIYWNKANSETYLKLYHILYIYQVVDMRWGVREDASDDHSTTKLCFDEISNCQQISCGPNFIVSTIYTSTGLIIHETNIYITCIRCICKKSSVHFFLNYCYGRIY